MNWTGQCGIHLLSRSHYPNHFHQALPHSHFIENSNQTNTVPLFLRLEAVRGGVRTASDSPSSDAGPRPQQVEQDHTGAP